MDNVYTIYVLTGPCLHHIDMTDGPQDVLFGPRIHNVFIMLICLLVHTMSCLDHACLHDIDMSGGPQDILSGPRTHNIHMSGPQRRLVQIIHAWYWPFLLPKMPFGSRTHCVD